MRQLLLISHRSPEQPGGPAARWRSMLRQLPHEGWKVDVLCAPANATSSEFALTERTRAAVAVRSRLMSFVRHLTAPLFSRLLGTRPPPLSTLWLGRGVVQARRRLRRQEYELVVATGPPMVALLVARLATERSEVPLVIELRDLWAGNPAYDAGGRALTRVQHWILCRAQAIVVCTPEAAADLRLRHPDVADRVRVIANGYEPELLAQRQLPLPRAGRLLEILHSGTLTLHRPLTPLLNVLQREPYRSHFRLRLHGYVVPEHIREVRDAARRCPVELVPPSNWTDAVQRIATCDIGLITQAASAGDGTAVASKVYEYLALGKPVLCLTDGGATEALLKRLQADRWCARLGDEHAIASALDDLLADPSPPPLSEEALRPYDRARLASAMCKLLGQLAGAPAAPGWNQ